jgi:endoglucanase
MNDSSDPFFTHLQAGAFPVKKPNGNLCDAAFNCHSGSGLSTGAKVALGVSLSIIGITIVAAGSWYYCTVLQAQSTPQYILRLRN